VRRLFWDVEADTVDPRNQRAFVLDRVLEYGGLPAVRWAEEFYGLDGIREYFLGRGQRTLSAKTRAYWSAVLDLPERSCTSNSSPTHNAALWPY